MSIYATLLDLSEDNEDGFGAPYIFRGSHVLPKATDSRDGWVEVADIPDHGRPVDFVRLDCAANSDGDPSVTNLLDRRQVEALRDCLTAWLEREPGV